MRPGIVIFALCCVYLSGLCAPPQDNIFVTSGTEEYKITRGKNGPVIKNSSKEVYEALRHGEKLHKFIYYNDIIKLDEVSERNALYKNANSPTVFHDDSKFCYFDIELPYKGKKAKVEYKRTFLDPAYFAKVPLAGDYPVKSKTVVFKIPEWMSSLTLTDCNFPQGCITRDDTTDKNGTRIVTYTITDLPAVKDEVRSPGVLRALPYILIGGYFTDVDSLYGYHRPLLETDTSVPGIDELTDEICSGAVSRRDSIDAIFRYVQKTVRYVAYEAGEAGYRPDRPAEVLRKKFGDCKGMALLVATLLRHIGVQAYTAAIGTRDIPFDISASPSLAATDHMICMVPQGGDTLWLDATNEYIPSNHVPYAIQGKEAMVFKDDGYELCRLPMLPPKASTDSLAYAYSFRDGALAGQVTRRLTGDFEEFIMDEIHSVPKHLQQEAVSRSLVPASRASVDTERLNVRFAPDGSAFIEAPIINNVAVTESEGHVYLDLNTISDPLAEKVDTDHRTNDYMLPLRGCVVRSASVEIPAGYKVTYIPENYTGECDFARFTCEFSRKGNTVCMAKSMEITNPEIPLEDIPQWNRMLGEWNDACNSQIELVKL